MSKTNKERHRDSAEIAMGRWWKPSQKVVAGMGPWWNHVSDDRKPPGQSDDIRTTAQQNFDSGVFAAAEFIRRMTGDEGLALAVHEMCFWRKHQRDN